MTTLEPGTSHRPDRPAFLPLPEAPRPAPLTSLAHAVQAAARALPDEALQRVAPVDAGLAFQPRTVVALLSYCYACGIYSSDDVEDLMRRDRNFRQLCNQEFPDARMLQRFRRMNRGAIQRCLEAALRFLAPRHAAGASGHGLTDAHFLAETQRRLNIAMYMDMP